MIEPGEILDARAEAPSRPLGAASARPAKAWSDLWKAPLHDFPIRDEILFQFLGLEPSMQLLEVGPGSGFTAFRLSRVVNRLTLVEFAPEATSELTRRLRGLSNVRCVCADICQPGLEGLLGERGLLGSRSLATGDDSAAFVPSRLHTFLAKRVRPR